MNRPAHLSQHVDIDTAAEPLRAELARRMASDGHLDDPAWRHAVETVARHQHVPGYYADSGRRTETGLTVWEPVTATTNPQRWLQGVYTDQTLITQFDGDEPDWNNPPPRIGGAPTSSSTLPSLVMRMWADADIHDGHDILEVGTGTGYSTALACERLDDTGQVTSIEVDSHRLDQAAAALYGAGYGPSLAVADGLHAYWPNAPYDRIAAACSVRRIPNEWLAQTRPGGKILTTLSGWMWGFARVLLTIGDHGGAEGPLLPGTISFMLARADSPPAFGTPAHWARLLDDAQQRPARHQPDRITAATAEAFHARFLAQLAAPTAQMTDDGNVTYLVDVTTGSVAALTPDDGTWTVREVGPVALWTTVETVLDAWDNAGRPGPEAFRVRVEGERQTISHVTAHDLAFPLP